MLRDVSSIPRRVPPLLVFALTGALMAGAAALWPRAVIVLPGRPGVALFLLLAGLAVAVAGVVDFRRAATTVDPRYPERASTLVSNGIYRYSRNPMYLGFALVLCGWAAWLQHLVALIGPAVFVLWMSRFQIPFEERAMHDRFGSAFVRYCRRTRRWI